MSLFGIVGLIEKWYKTVTSLKTIPLFCFILLLEVVQNLTFKHLYTTLSTCFFKKDGINHDIARILYHDIVLI